MRRRGSFLATRLNQLVQTSDIFTELLNFFRGGVDSCNGGGGNFGDLVSQLGQFFKRCSVRCGSQDHSDTWAETLDEQLTKKGRVSTRRFVSQQLLHLTEELSWSPVSNVLGAEQLTAVSDAALIPPLS